MNTLYISIRTCEHSLKSLCPFMPCAYQRALLCVHFFCCVGWSGIAIDCNGDWTGKHFVGGEASRKDGISQGYLATLQIIKPRLDKAFDSVGQLLFIFRLSHFQLRYSCTWSSWWPFHTSYLHLMRTVLMQITTSFTE